MDAIRQRGGVAVSLAEDRPDVEVNFRVAEPAITDDDLALLAGLEPFLTRLDLSRTAVTDAGLQHLLPFTGLVRLRLDDTAITDAGVETLTAVEGLTWLNLVGTRITDSAVDAIARLPRLEQVYLWKTDLTASGRAHLRRLRPDLEVVTAAPTLPPEPAKDEPEKKDGSDAPADTVAGDDDPT